MQVKIIPVGMLQTNCCMLIDEQRGVCALIDPGANTAKIMAAVEDAGVTVECIVLTHGHFDHILAAPEVQRLTGAKLMIHKADEHMLEPDYALHRGYIKEDYVKPRVDEYLEDGKCFSVGSLECRVMNTPGHTKGSCVIMCGEHMFSGDTLFCEDCGRCDLPGGDMGEMLVSLKRLIELDGDFKVYPGHEETTTLAHERLHNPRIPRA